MKKVLFTIIAVFVMAAAANAQSIQWHQSYDGNQKFVADFFKSDSNFNVYSYNEFTVTNNQAVGYGIIYGEYRIAGSHFLGHLETRFRTSSLDTNVFTTSTTPPAMYCPDYNMINAGFAYELLLGNFCFNLTPMYRYDVNYPREDTTRTNSNWQFSINSSADFEKFYYEGYLDIWGPNKFNLCTEQKVYYKITPMVHVGVNLMLFNVNGNDPKLSLHGNGQWNFQPWLVARLAF
jgi:hypothetical protein